MKRCCIFLGLLLCIGPWLSAHGQSADGKYVQIYNTIQEADTLVENGQPRQAINKYMEAQSGLKNLQTAFPGWHETVIAFRLNYIAEKLQPLVEKFPPTNAAPASTTMDLANVPLENLSTNQVLAMQEEIRRLTSQNALLQAKLKEAWSVQPSAVDPRELAKAEEKLREMEKERDLLKASLQEAQNRPADAGALEQERRILADVKQQLSTQTELAAGLQKENDTLKRQVAQLQASPAALAALGTGPIAEQLQIARLTINALQATNTALRTDLLVMEERLNNVNTQNRQVGRPDKSLEDLQHQLEALRARVDVYESKPVPYSVEELALFKQPDLRATIVETNTAAPVRAPANSPTPANAGGKQRAKELPPGTGPVMEEALRAASAGKYDEAEKKLVQVLRQDEKNVYTLSQLAAVQMDQRRYDEAEQNIRSALQVDREDPLSLFLLGYLKYQQEKYDEALDALSMSARLLPDEARTQYFLGKTLVQKGNRVQAEKALRKAVQLKSNWGEAHYSLAVIYASQKPPYMELAQWHYDKALASGYPPNSEFEKILKDKANVASSN